MRTPKASTVRKQLAEARDEVSCCLLAWERYDCRQATQSELIDAKECLADLDLRLPQLDNWQFQARSRELFLLSIRQTVERIFQSIRGGILGLLRLQSLDWLSASLLIATIPVVLIGPVLALMSVGVGWIVVVVAFAYLGSLIPAAISLYSLDHLDLASRISHVAQWVEQRGRAIGEATEDHLAARRHLERLRLLWRLQSDYEAANAELKRIQAIQASQRFQLTQRDWRSLRGVPFENFLADVFEELGYSVETTKTSGDQGVDLILTGKGERIAVQAKGYTESVGNGAIQEVYAGMAFYQCNRCVAITNSNFTSAARELARSVGCMLIDGTRILDLIEGRIL